ncbi:rho guanine nucleotide exchange factor 26-like [Poeciliopsis prolifica]|uniref:rho guanine nucleotide exchange factor 26-like n=1 Tax=Poeciliopsis prolifica TaxID=188132 RepID=UPI0024139BA8|nr:rho guanine nucleotide exchange factor 26-like [Poeciliopsis prolifica]XP_054901733.1 rho guanine nucleotide exchange factor 26-like [Poeciliopsis prolifica]XP_054901734.1 rho guanine nucleotide exchange factor 26-like [Poeciliopsis prolifica]
MDLGNDVDLSNNNITPLWRRRTDLSEGPQDSNQLKPRPVSYHVNGVTTADFPVGDDGCSFTLSQPPQPLNTNTMVLKHVLHRPSEKKRIVRSISIGRLYSGRFSLPKFKAEDKKATLDNRVCNGSSNKRNNQNGSVCSENHHQDMQRSTTNPVDLDLEKDHVSSGTNTLSPETPTDNCSPHSPNNYHYELSSQSSLSSSSSTGYGTLTPSHSSSSSIPSLSSLTSSDPPTPRSPSPADRGNSLQCQTTSSASSYDTLYASSSSSQLPPNFSTSPSLSPAASSSPTIVLSTNSPAALKMGTQQLIPKGLASDVRQTKAPPTGTQRLGLDHSKRAVKVLSMVEAGGYFSTGGGHTEEAEGENESPGALRRGLRSTSYRRAVVSEVDKDVTSVELKMPVMEGLENPGSLNSSTNLATLSPTSAEAPKAASPRISKSSSPRMDKTKSNKKNKTLNKKKLTSQLTFDSEEEELYQNYQEKALHNDSDEDADARGPKPDQGIVVQYRPIRTSWSQLSVVKKNALAEQLSQEERKRQEAIFEVISSEHSYLHSLEILIRMFKNSSELSEAMSKIEHHHLFSNISDVCQASKKFFKELEERHQQSIVIDDISDIVCKHAESNFDPYIKYCSNEVYQQRTLQRLVGAKNSAFKEVLTRLEGHPDCRSLPMISFLILPMQRITRLPLLLDTICQKTSKDSARYETCKKALQAVSKVVRKCNEGARTMERTEMMYTINTQLEFKIKPFPLVSSSRWMVKRGELTAFVEDSGIFTKRKSRQHVYFFLFNDVLIVTKKKGEDSHTVIDYALRDQIQVGSSQPEDVHLSPAKSPTSMLSSRQVGANHLFRLCFRSNHSSEKVAMILGTESESERARWISALGQNDNDERRHDRTNVTQVEVIRTYTAKQPDELSLQVADVVLVSQHVDGWYEGERLRDGEAGWFPAECGEEITCQATIERNMQRMNRLQGLETNV